MTTAPQVAQTTPLSRLNKTGLVLAFLLGLADLTSPFTQSPGQGDEAGPPYPVLVLDGILGLITVVTVVIAWRAASRRAVRLVAGARVISMITALPAFFVDVPAAAKVLVGVFVLVTLGIVAMMLAPPRRTAAVTD